MLRILKAVRIFSLVAICLATQAATDVIRPQALPGMQQGPKAQPGVQGPKGMQGRKLPIPSQAQARITSSQVQKAIANCTEQNSKSPIIILSIDGAAVRGISQFELLLGLEEKINKILATKARDESGGGLSQYRKLSLTDMFDLFAGTSAGSVNVGALLIPKDYALSNTPNHKNEAKFTPDELKAMLPDTLKAAFATSTWRKFRTAQIPGVGGLLGSKFTAKPFEQLLQDLSGPARMSDLVKPGLITSYDLRSREIMNFSTYNACALGTEDDIVNFQPQRDPNFYRKYKNVFVWQAVRASSAAPVFYKPLELYIDGKPRALIDAGLFVMSPTFLALIEARKEFPGRRLIIISISSGNFKQDREVQTEGSTAGSIPKVLQVTIETSLEGQQALTDTMMKNQPGVTYHRLSFEVRNKDFDDTSPENIKALEEAAKATIATAAFDNAAQDVANGILERKEKLKTDPTDFVPFVCKAKVEFNKRKYLGLPDHDKRTDDMQEALAKNKNVAPADYEKAAQVKEAVRKMGDAADKMGKLNEQGKRMVEFGNSAQDQELKKAAALSKQTCQALLGQGKTQTLEWTERHCNNILDSKEICQGLTLGKTTIEADLNNNNCNKFSFRKSPTCPNLSALLKKNAQELKARKCELRA